MAGSEVLLKAKQKAPWDYATGTQGYLVSHIRPSLTRCYLENCASPCRPSCGATVTKAPEAANLVRPAAPSSCCVSARKLWESEGAGCVIPRHFMYVCVCVFEYL